MHARIMTAGIMVAALAVGLSAQTSTSAKATVDKAWSVPRTPEGHPDMQGVWANNGMTPLERPAQWGTRATMTDAELADLKCSAIARLRQKIDEARGQGWDLFTEMVQQVRREIARAQGRLASLSRSKVRDLAR